MTKVKNNNKQNHQSKHNNKPKNHQNSGKEQSFDLKCHTIQELYHLAEGFYNELRSANKNDKWH